MARQYSRPPAVPARGRACGNAKVGALNPRETKSSGSGAFDCPLPPASAGPLSCRPARVRALLTSAPGTLVVSLLATAILTVWFRRAWNPPSDFYFYNVPIAVPFVAFFLDRLVPSREPRCAALAIDAVVLALALARVFIPPFPFVSGHTLFTAYASGTARRWPLRLTATAVLLQVIYAKTILGGGWQSMVGGLVVAGAFVIIRRGCRAGILESRR
jgi:hypothetical protein